MYRRLKTSLLFITLAAVAACTGVPEGISPVENFDVEKYLGTWYEIARLDHSFERGLDQVTATYSRREDGGVKVINRGFNRKEGSWSEAEGKAYFTQTPDIGALKVSFFGPFYGAYNIIALDKENYQWVMICGNNRDYLWIMSRNPNLDQQTINRLLGRAKALGFATDKLIWVDHGEGPTSEV